MADTKALSSVQTCQACGITIPSSSAGVSRAETIDHTPRIEMGVPTNCPLKPLCLASFMKVGVAGPGLAIMIASQSIMAEASLAQAVWELGPSCLLSSHFPGLAADTAWNDDQ